MDTEQARAILRANEVKQRALLNLENAARMSTDDPRSKELLEEAGDAYVSAAAELYRIDMGVIDSLPGFEEEAVGIASIPDDSQGDQGQPPPPEQAA